MPLLAALVLPTIEANWFGYGSSREAYSACRDWVRKNKNNFVYAKEIRKQDKYLATLISR